MVLPQKGQVNCDRVARPRMICSDHWDSRPRIIVSNHRINIPHAPEYWAIVKRVAVPVVFART
jgi:hypothetical protein